MKPVSIRWSALLVLMATVLCSGVVSDQVIGPDHDGPYVYWHDSTKATVFYLCQGRINEREFENFDTLRFQRFCEEEALWHKVPAASHQIEPCRFEGVAKLFAVSDVHGEYQELVDLLKVSGVIDSALHWNWGEGHLVFNGDVFDRGDRVTEVLWLVYRLEQEARLSGGRVHYLMGNHENMVLWGDNRYINEKYLQGVVKKSRIRHHDLYGPDMELGRWLRTKHTMIIINDILFVHGGVSPQMIERGLTVETVNEQGRAFVDLRSSQVKFNDEAQFLFGRRGPIWYRGFFLDYDDSYTRLTQPQVEEILNVYDVSAAVVGHTEQDQVTSFYDGRVYSIDVPVEELGGLQGLLWESGQFYRVTTAGEREILN